MKYIIVFRSKTDLYTFIDDLLVFGIKSQITQTPQKIVSGCNLSAQINVGDLSKIFGYINLRGYKSFYGVFKICQNIDKTIAITQIY